jgi:hypothetical protein
MLAPERSATAVKAVSNSTYVCFECRTTERVPDGRITRNCRKCRRRAEHVYHKFKIPRGDDDAAWRELLTKVRLFNRQAKSNALLRLGQERANLERLLARVPASKPHRQRSLRLQLKTINESVEKWKLW